MESHSEDKLISASNTTNINISLRLGKNRQDVAFAEHLNSVFQNFPSHLSRMEEETINNKLNIPHPVDLPMQKTRISDVQNVTQQEINPKTVIGYNLNLRHI